jgi:hypothetical protein
MPANPTLDSPIAQRVTSAKASTACSILPHVDIAAAGLLPAVVIDDALMPLWGTSAAAQKARYAMSSMESASQQGF